MKQSRPDGVKRVIAGNHCKITVRALGMSVFLLLAPSVFATEYYVSPSGNDGNSGTAGDPWQTISHAAEFAVAGDTVHVLVGTYAESVHFVNPGEDGSPIRFIAEGEVLVNASGNSWGLFVDGYEDTAGRWVELTGFEVTGADRGGIRASWAPHVTVRNCTCYNNGLWGIFTDFSDDLLLESNWCHDNVGEHGIYVSNSGDRPVIRLNVCNNNTGCGIQINADPTMGGDGITSDALIEDNICFENGSAGGAGINLASVRTSVVRNNLLYDNLAGGIAGWGDGNGPDWGCKNNRFFNNIVYFRSGEGRWCLSLKEGSTGNTALNNLFIGGRRGALEFSTDSFSGLTTDYNGLFCQDSTSIATEEDVADYDLASWQTRGYDAHSRSTAPESVFTDVAGTDFHHRTDSLGIDCGSDQDAWIPTVDMEGHPRTDDPNVPNAGAGVGFYDLGCYEYQSGGAPTPTPAPTATATPLGPCHLGAHPEMPDSFFTCGESCRLDARLCNPTDSDYPNTCLFIVLQVYDTYYFWDGAGWGPDPFCVTIDLGRNSDEVRSIIPEFAWPQETGSLTELFFWGAFTDHEITAVLGEVSSFEFGFGC